jgi:hypothetical protein
MYLTDEQRSKLASLARSEGVSEAEVVRRILDHALGMPDADAERLAAVDETAGLLADTPDWPEWLAKVRRQGADPRLRELGL